MEDQKEINPQSAAHAARWLMSDKPDWMSSTSVSVVGVLIVHSADDHALKTSFVELGAVCGCHQDTAKRAVRDLVAHKWVTLASSPWNAHEFTLTKEYLKHLKVKVEVSEDAKDFASWFLAIQKKNQNEIRPRNRKSIGAKTYEFRDHNNAARILTRAGGLQEAKSMVNFALSCPTFRRRSLQGLYNLKAVINTQSFKDQFAHGLVPPPVEAETPQQKLTRLLKVLKDEQDKRKSLRRQMNMLTGSAKAKAELAVIEQEKVVELANDLAAHQAVKMGMNPERVFPDEIEHPLRYTSQFAQMQTAGEGGGTSCLNE
jgi:hypothetical protein